MVQKVFDGSQNAGLIIKTFKANKDPNRKINISKSNKAKLWERRLRFAPVNSIAFLANHFSTAVSRIKQHHRIA